MFKIKNPFIHTPKPASDLWKDSRYVIEYVFTACGKDWYRFVDGTNIPYERGLYSILFFNELKENCDAEYMKAHYLKTKEILRSAKIDVFEINKINEQLGERLYKLPPLPQLIERLASVIYFCKEENPTTYDAKYCAKKIKNWRKAFPDGSFFLSEPISSLVPFLKESLENLKNYHEIYDRLVKVDQLHLENLSLKESANNGNKLKAKADA